MSKNDICVIFNHYILYLYPSENSQYSYVGKFGLALCGNDQESLYRIILYTAKNQTICSATITENFPFLVSCLKIFLFFHLLSTIILSIVSTKELLPYSG